MPKIQTLEQKTSRSSSNRKQTVLPSSHPSMASLTKAARATPASLRALFTTSARAPPDDSTNNPAASAALQAPARLHAVRARVGDRRGLPDADGPVVGPRRVAHAVRCVARRPNGPVVPAVRLDDLLRRAVEHRHDEVLPAAHHPRAIRAQRRARHLRGPIEALHRLHPLHIPHLNRRIRSHHRHQPRIRLAPSPALHGRADPRLAHARRAVPVLRGGAEVPEARGGVVAGGEE
eukprot:CAMPEP_0174903100 /NCGR_PEP_ID=MMETSP0167-20121228/41991_1 /TAXON_ID=38298 /ORGANISM="Rhodella maculata, Strain CCMP736" /LENGTH=233 /DNA_ID=CAMNT_0016145327 /DNA_START=198 /DNA_END=900 /DNA_ORIENTATION=+